MLTTEEAVEQTRRMCAQGQLQSAYSLLTSHLLHSPVLTPHPYHLAVKLTHKTSPDPPISLLRQAEVWLRTWKTLSPTDIKLKKWTIRTQIAIAKVFIKEKKYHKALNALMKAVKHSKHWGNRLQSEAYLAVGGFYMEIRSFAEAEKYALKAIRRLQAILLENPEKRVVEKLKKAYKEAFSLISKAGGRQGRSPPAPVKPAVSSPSPIKPTTDRYYSQDQLTHLHLKITSKSPTLPFTSTDSHFSKAIFQWLNSDKIPLKPLLTPTDIKIKGNEDKEDSKNVRKLRVRKYFYREKKEEVRGKERVLKEIRKLEENEKKKTNLRMIRRKKTPETVKIATFPAQRLFFRLSEDQSPISTSLNPSFSPNPAPKSTQNRKTDYLEDLMTELEHDISSLNSKKARKIRVKSVISPRCELAESVLNKSSLKFAGKRGGNSEKVEILVSKLSRKAGFRRAKTVSIETNRSS